MFIVTKDASDLDLYFLGLAGDLKKAMKDGKPIIIEVWLVNLVLWYVAVNYICRL